MPATADATPMLLKRGSDKGVQAVVAELKRLSTLVNTAEETAQVAAVCSGDESIGEMLSEVMSKVGKDGVMTVAEAQGLRLEQDYVDGMQVDVSHGNVSYEAPSDAAAARAMSGAALVVG